MSLQPVTRWADQGRDFNKPVAQAVYSTLMKMQPAEAVMFSRVLVDAIMEDDLMVHGEMIAKAANAEVARRAELLKAHLAHTAIAKHRDGADATPELRALDAISKNFIGDMFDHAHRATRARKEQRDVRSGQFVRQTNDIVHDSTRPVHDAQAGVAATPEAWGDLLPEQKAAYQQAYAQVAALVEPYKRLPSGTAFVELIDNRGLPTIVPIPDRNGALGAHHFDPRGDRKIVQSKISVIPPPDTRGALFGLFDALGMPVTGAVAAGSTTGGGVLDPRGLDTFRESVAPGAQNVDEHIPSQRVFRRLTAGSKLIEDTLGPVAPPHARMALSVATHVGTLGPSAQKVIGPTVDRAAYRYRGTERKPAPELLNAMQTDARTASTRSGLVAESMTASRDADKLREQRRGQNLMNHDARIRDARTDFERAGYAYKNKTIPKAEYKMRAKRAQQEIEHARNRLSIANKFADTEHATAAAAAQATGKKGAAEHARLTSQIISRGYPGDDRRWKPGETLAYFKSRVPSPELNALHLKAGTVPPSEGVILDSKGNVTSQAVGYGDDHYLPFTLRGLRKLRGGSYIRTRTWGGPTSEDIRTALVGGARRLTVVSNNGVFTVDFDPDFKGGRRHNDKAHRMIGRYEHLLDAVRKGEVSRAALDPTVLEDLEKEAAGIYTPSIDPQGYQRKLAELKADAIKNPRMSEAQKNEVATEFIRSLAVNNGTKGAETTPAELVDQIAMRRAADAHRGALAELRERNKYLEMARSAGDLPAGFEMPTAPSMETLHQAELDKLRADSPQAAAANIADALGKAPQYESFMKRAQQRHFEDLQQMTLNGPGYAAALEALQQQFPYYIASTKFNRWDNQAQMHDTGYVRPGKLRPADARAGLFDGPSGNTKVGADTIRFQGGTASSGSPASTVVPVAAAATATSTAVSSDASLQSKADAAMLETLLNMQGFGPNAKLTKTVLQDGQQVTTEHSLANVAFTKELTSRESFPDPLKQIFDANPDALREELRIRPVETRAKMKAADAYLSKINGYPEGVDSTLTAFRNAGRPPEASGETNPTKILAQPNGEYSFADDMGTAYRHNGGAGSEEIVGKYMQDPRVGALVTVGALPAQVNSDDFPAKAGTLQAALVAQDNALARWNLDHAGPKPVDEEAHRQAVYGLIQAKTLHRRYEEAVTRQNEAYQAEQAQKQKDIEIAQAGAPVNATILDYTAFGPQDWERLASDPMHLAHVVQDIENAHYPGAADSLLAELQRRSRFVDLGDPNRKAINR